MSTGNLDFEELAVLADEKIALGQELIKQLEAKFEEIDGIPKVKRVILSELKFLEKVKRNRTIKVNHILCSNLTYFQALVHSLNRRKGNVQAVNYPIPIEGRESKLRIDIITNTGVWVKVCARNSQNLKNVFEGQASYGTKSIVDHGVEIMQAARVNSFMFKQPRVVFEFSKELDDEVKAALEEVGIEIEIVGESSPELVEAPVVCHTVNLDVTTLMAFCSNMTNGMAHFRFNENLLTEQAEHERREPVLAMLEKTLEGKELICCQTAVDSFQEILTLVGGDTEKKRAAQLLNRIEVLPDVEVPEELKRLAKYGKKIKPRSLSIFGFGLAHKLLTVTANNGFIRSAKMQGIEIPAIIHEARALTEQKEATAKILVDH